MKSFLSSILVVVAVLGMTASFATVAQADTIYAGWKTATTQLNAHDLATGALLAGFTPTVASVEGMGISPLDGKLYVANSRTITKYDPATGANLGTFASTLQKTQDVVFDNAGNLYAASYNNTITKVASNGDVSEGWGGLALESAQGLEIYGGKLYGGTYDGVAKWNLATGVYEGYLTPPDVSALGVAFDPDGTLYTVDALNTSTECAQVRKWNSDYTTSVSLFEVSANPFNTEGFAGGDRIGDVDYYDGSLYVCGSRKVYRYDLATETASEFIVHNTAFFYGASGGYIAIVPEPGTLAMLAGGLLGLLCYAWRKRKCAPR